MTAVAHEFSAPQRAAIDQTIRAAEQASRFEFSVFVGAAEGEQRAFAERLHASLSAPDRSVLIMVDPVARLLEVVTGRDVRRVLTDHDVALAVLEMRTEFASGDLVRGLRRGISMLALHSRAPRTLHAEA